MGASWTCQVCGTNVLGSVCPHHQDWQHVEASHSEEIDRLRAENERLRGALETIRKFDGSMGGAMLTVVRAALKPASGQGGGE